MLKIVENAKRLYNLKLNQTIPSYKRYIFDDLNNSSAKITAIYGSRGIGKTTLLMQILQNSPLPH
ncbi:MAG: ATP-binding protein, partial [Campylobacterales bacterium]|nr:ATP-binding protein [Campylobacterales bacterium]